MKYFQYLVLGLLMVAAYTMPSKGQSAKNIHQKMHSELLANAKNTLDKSVLQEYIQQEIEEREQESLYGISEESVAMIQDLLSEAQSHTGKRYRSGGKGPDRFDCSGFTSYVYRQFGYKLGASSASQYGDGVEIEKDDLRPGDLVFFTSPRSRGGVGHVGIVVDADNENHTFNFIHAATSSGIQIDRSSAPYYAKRYVGARRIITE